jgi:hypothetical protein
MKDASGTTKIDIYHGQSCNADIHIVAIQSLKQSLLNHCVFSALFYWSCLNNVLFIQVQLFDLAHVPSSWQHNSDSDTNLCIFRELIDRVHFLLHLLHALCIVYFLPAFWFCIVHFQFASCIMHLNSKILNLGKIWNVCYI